MTQVFIEHVNLNVSDPQRTAEIVSTLFGWHIRWQGTAMDGRNTIHVGDDCFYLALHDNGASTKPASYAKGIPFNHVGICVDNLDTVEARARALGLTPFGHDDYEPGRRFYFFDPDNIEFEIVSYTKTGMKTS